MAARLNGGDDAHLDPGWTAMKQLAANCKAIAQSTSNLTDMLTTGEVWIAPWWDGRAYALVDEGVPVDFVVPKEGAFNTNVEMIITKYSKNQEMAYKFLNAMKCILRTCMEEGAFGLSSGLSYIPGAFTPTEELIALCRELVPFHGIYNTHMRNESNHAVNR